MLSMPHLIVLFVVALVIFGPQKLPELARMLGKATAEFRKMTGDFRYALEEEVRELDRQTRIREAEANAASSQPQPSPATVEPAHAGAVPLEPEGTMPRDVPPSDLVATTISSGGLHASPEAFNARVEPAPVIELPPPADTDPAAVAPVTATPAHEKPSDDNAAV
jgi:TatA/E family protein of Tat protein translocase